MGYRRQAREIALQTLYLCDTSNISMESALKTTLLDFITEQVKKFSEHLVRGVFQHKEEIDAMISRTAENWELNRMAVVDRNILRVSTFEIISDPNTPISVIIDEALEISKIYSTQESSKFINGILDKVKQERNP